MIENIDWLSMSDIGNQNIRLVIACLIRSDKELYFIPGTYQHCTEEEFLNKILHLVFSSQRCWEALNITLQKKQ